MKKVAQSRAKSVAKQLKPQVPMKKRSTLIYALKVAQNAGKLGNQHRRKQPMFPEIWKMFNL
jgi:hypothetical protein